MSHILLIEPNTLLAKTYLQALEHAGFSVTHVVGAQTAIDAADEKTPDVVIAELHLPQHSAVEFLHEFRSYEDWISVPVVINTSAPAAQTAQFSEELRRELGVRKILYKPQTSLQDMIRVARELSAVAESP